MKFSEIIEALISLILFVAFVAVVWMWLTNPQPQGTIRITF